jgi:putative sporulation protein YtaF
MHFLYTIFIAIANNLDNISVRIAYSIRGIRISLVKNLWISSITFIFSSLSAFSGSILSKLLNHNITSVLSMFLLIVIGLWIILEPYLNKKKSVSDKNSEPPKNIIYNILIEPESADADNSKDINFKEATFLGIALSLDSIGGGLGAGMIGLNGFLVGFFSALLSFISLFAGNYLTEFLSKRKLGNQVNIIAGVLLILIGVKQIM